MTIVFKGQALFTLPPTLKDALFIQHMANARDIWERDGRPSSGDFA